MSHGYIEQKLIAAILVVLTAFGTISVFKNCAVDGVNPRQRDCGMAGQLRFGFECDILIAMEVSVVPMSRQTEMDKFLIDMRRVIK